MNKILKAFLLYILFSSQLFANWSDLNTGIVDNLKGVRFWGTNGVVVGEKGFYYTQTGGNGPSSWNRFVITANYTDSLVYEQCSFSAIDSHTSNIAYICGQDTIANRSVIFSFNVNTLTYAIVFVGPVGSALNNIKFNTTGSLLFAVGDNGFVVRSNLSAYNIVSIGINNDLNSVSVNAGKVVIAGDGVMVNCTDNGSTLIPTVYNHPLVDIRSAYPVNSTSIYGVGSTFYKFTSGGGVYTSMSNYDPVILNGNDIFYSTSGFYIATNSGIYLTDFNATYAEFQVNSGNLKYNKIWFTSTSSTLGYAVGPNGLVVKTSQGGVPNKPYARILSSNINCKGDLSSLVAHPGSATNCNWVLNSLPISSTCGGLNYTFNTEGTYTLSYIVWNSSGIYDTVSKIIEVVLPPLTNITVDVNDSILCKKEAIVITLDTSQVGYVYSLNTAMQSNNLGACMGGNGSAILNSDSLDTGGSYFIKVTSTLSQCYKIITDSIDIVVEKTKANFHNSYINSNTTEINTIFDNSDDAQNYLWTFPVGSSPVSSSIQNPTVSFTIPGYNEIKLVVWSDNGCFDSIVKTGPFVYIEPQPEDTCWAFAVDGEDPPYVNYYSPGFLDINKVKTGYLISGRTYKDIFTSRLGLSYGRTETRGGVLCRYSSNGVLKWMIMNRDFTPTPVGSIESLVASCATDKDGNIYITGNSIGGSYFYLNNGDSVQIANPDSLGGPYSYTSHCYIAKLDSLGNLLWRTVITHGKPFNITLDKSNNILLMADVGSNSLYFKSYSSQPIPNVDGNQKILLKIDNNGNLIWCSKISLNYSNSIQFSECNIDHSNNIYITGSYEYNSTFYSSNSPFSLSISSSSVGEKFYVVKYDSTGLVKWLVKGITSNIPNNGSAGTGIVVDSLGNSYVCGVTAISTNNSNNNFIVTDSYTSHTTNVGSFFLMKINTNGILNWITGMKKQSSTACYSPKLAIFNDRIGLIGKVHITGFTPWTGDIMSTNGDSMSITLNRGDAVVADYDTAGVLHDVYYISNSNIYSGIMPISLQMDNNNYYVLGHASMNINSSTFACLNDVIIPNGAYESLVAKMERVGCLPGVITNSNINSIQLKSISVFPNPNSGNEIEIISTISSGQIKIYDSLGGVVYSSSFNSPNFRLSCQNVLNSSGIYIIELISENDRVYSKLVVNK